MHSVTEPSAGAAGPIPARGATGGSRRGRPGAGSLRKDAVGDIRAAPRCHRPTGFRAYQE